MCTCGRLRCPIVYDRRSGVGSPVVRVYSTKVVESRKYRTGRGGCRAHVLPRSRLFLSHPCALPPACWPMSEEEWADGHYLADLSVAAGGEDGGGCGRSGAADLNGGGRERALSPPTPLAEAAALSPPISPSLAGEATWGGCHSGPEWCPGGGDHPGRRRRRCRRRCRRRGGGVTVIRCRLARPGTRSGRATDCASRPAVEGGG